MRGGRGWRFLLLVAPVLFGLLAMHALVAPPGASAAGNHGGMVVTPAAAHDPDLSTGRPHGGTAPAGTVDRIGHGSVGVAARDPGQIDGAPTSGADAIMVGNAAHADGDPAPGPVAPPTAPGAGHPGPVGHDVAGHPGPAGHDVAGHLLHLCLAVLAALGVVVLAAWVFLGRLPSTAPVATPSHGWSVPAGRPPPVPRRLATLCVLRN